MLDPVFIVMFVMFWASASYIAVVSVQALVNHLIEKEKDK